MTSKSPWRSKTLWFNALSGAAFLLGGPLAAAIPPKYAVPALAVANLGLRVVTTAPLALPAPDDRQ